MSVVLIIVLFIGVHGRSRWINFIWKQNVITVVKLQADVLLSNICGVWHISHLHPVLLRKIGLGNAFSGYWVVWELETTVWFSHMNHLIHTFISERYNWRPCILNGNAMVCAKGPIYHENIVGKQFDISQNYLNTGVLNYCWTLGIKKDRKRKNL